MSPHGSRHTWWQVPLKEHGFPRWSFKSVSSANLSWLARECNPAGPSPFWAREDSAPSSRIRGPTTFSGNPYRFRPTRAAVSRLDRRATPLVSRVGPRRWGRGDQSTRDGALGTQDNLVSLLRLPPPFPPPLSPPPTSGGGLGHHHHS